MQIKAKTMLGTFIKGKLQDKLKTFFELQTSSIEGLTIRNIGIKPNLLQQLSQLIQVPLLLTSGNIDYVKLNIPWQNLLFTKKDQPISVQLSGIRIKAKLPNELQRVYVNAMKKKIIQQFTQQFNTETTSKLTFINKLKQHFLGSFSLQVKNIQIEINIQFKYSLISTLSAQSIKFQKDIKSQQTKLQIKDICLGYKLPKQTKQQYIIYKADFSLSGTKQVGEDTKLLSTNNLQISFNNQNFNDIRRVIALISWHNSFVNLPQQLWEFKPSIIGQVGPNKKARYVGRIIIHKVKETKGKKICQILIQRRNYIKQFQIFRKNPNNQLQKRKLNEIQEKIDVWKVKQYRKFCLLRQKKVNALNKLNSSKQKQTASNNISWLTYWFPKSEQNVLKQLQVCLENTHASLNKKHLTLNIQQIKIIVSIKSLTGKQPFLNIFAINNQFEYFGTPISKQQHGEVKYDSLKKFTINKLYIQFDKYGGHHQTHKYLMSQKNITNINDRKMSQDQFEDIENFFQCEISKKQIQMKIIPFIIKLNEDTLQKFSVFKMERIHNTFSNTQTLVFEENTFEQQKSKKQQKKLTINTSIYLLIPENMYEKQVQQIQVCILDLIFIKLQNQQKLEIQQVLINAYLLTKQDKSIKSESIKLMSQTYQQKRAFIQKMQLLKTNIKMKKQIHQSIQQINWVVNTIKIQLTSMRHIKQLIRLISKLKPKSKNKKPLYKIKHMRRKQSIGQQFIDACQNLQEHLIRSATLSEKTKHEKYIIKDKRNIKTKIQVESIKVIFQSSQIQLSKCTITIFQFLDYKSIVLSQEQKNINIRIFAVKNFINNLQEISKEVERSLQLKSKKQQNQLRATQNQLQGDTFAINQLNIYVQIYYERKLKFVLQISNIMFQIQRDQNIKIQMGFGLSIYRRFLQKTNKNKSQIQKQIKQAIIQKFKLNYIHEKQYNKDEKMIKISDIDFNIKPYLFSEIGILFDKLNTPEQLKIQIANSTINNLNISTTGNIYKQYGPGAVAISTVQKCDIIIFGKKQSLNLKLSSSTETIQLTRNLCLMKKKRSQYSFSLQSNLHITNRQQHTIWIRILTNRTLYELRKSSMKQAGIVTFQQLSSAHVDSFNQGKTNKTNVKRSTSLQSIFDEKDNDNDSDLGQQLQMKKVTVIRTLRNSNMNNKFPAEKDSIRELQSLQFKNLNEDPILQKKINSEKSTKKASQNISKLQTINVPFNQHQVNKQILLHAIEPQQTVQLLLSSQDYYIELLQLDKKGQIFEKYHAFKVKEALEDKNQKILHSYVFDSHDDDKNNVSSSLVVATTKIIDEQNTLSPPTFILQILSPFVMVNKIPTQIQFRFSKEQVDMLEVIKSAGQQIRKRSFQATELQKIQPFKINRVNTIQYNEVSQVQINIKGYVKAFRLDHIIQNIKKPQQDIDLRITDHLCLNNGTHQIQMGIQIRLLKHVMKITIFPQFIFVNMTSITLQLQIKQDNYNYIPIKMQGLKDHNHYKMFMKMNNQKIGNYRVLQQLFKQYQDNISTFTGSFDQNIPRSVKYGNQGNFQITNLYDTYQQAQNKVKQKIIQYGSKQSKLVARKIKIDDKPIYILLFMPSLFVINKSDWSFFIKRQGDQPKKLLKHSVQYMLINQSFSVQACQEHEDIAFGQWMKISLNTLGTIYYAKQMTSSSGYESREYQLRKKRLKKAPKLFFRIVMTKYEYGHQILIQESQYPPVTFINRCKFRVRVKEMTENVFEEMQMNQMAEYASKIPHHNPKFQLAVVENYQFKKLGQFSLQQPNFQKILKNRIKISTQQYKDKQIVIIQDYTRDDKSKFRSMLRNQLMLQKIQKMIILINKIEVSILTGHNKQLSCACIKQIQLNHQSKYTKKYVKLNVANIQILSYNGLQPRYLFYSKQNINVGITKAQVLGLFKKKIGNQTAINPTISSNLMNSFSNINSSLSHTSIQPSHQSSLNSSSNPPILHLDLVIDYHKHATILQRCKVIISQLVIVLNANTIIDYFKYYYQQFCGLVAMIRKHQFGRMIIHQIQQAVNPTGQQANNKYDNTLSINNIQNNNNIVNSSANINNNQINQISPIGKTHNKIIHRNSVESNNYYNTNLNSNSNDVDFMNRGFVIQNFSWQGLKITIKFQNLQNLQYFMNNKQIKYLIKFITWIGDLRPIQFSPTQVQYQQYTIMKLLQLIDINKLIRQLSQTFLEYPIRQFYHIMSFITKLVGLNDLQQNNQQWSTLKKLGKSALKVTKRLFAINHHSPTYIADENGQLKESKNYVQKFMEQNLNDNDIVDKILKFKYQQWRYKQETRINKLNLKVQRLERYSSPSQLLPYQPHKARIQTALNDHCGNKIYREVTIIQPINKDSIIGLTQDWFVLYMIDKQQWIIAKPQHVLQIRIDKLKNQNKVTFGLSFGANSVTKQLIIIISTEKQGIEKHFKLQVYRFSSVLATDTEIQLLQNHIHQLKLSNVY